MQKNDFKRKLNKIEQNVTETAGSVRATLEKADRERMFGRRGDHRPRPLGVTKKIRYGNGTVRKFMKFNCHRRYNAWTPLVGPVGGFTWSTTDDLDDNSQAMKTIKVDLSNNKPQTLPKIREQRGPRQGPKPVRVADLW